ncbi:hypothetical protein AAMO2058_001104800 [Amorphochlora amoebiformis]
MGIHSERENISLEPIEWNQKAVDGILARIAATGEEANYHTFAFYSKDHGAGWYHAIKTKRSNMSYTIQYTLKGCFTQSGNSEVTLRPPPRSVCHVTQLVFDPAASSFSYSYSIAQSSLMS